MKGVPEVETRIGEAAGRIWQSLNTNGPASKAQIGRLTSLSSDLLDQGIGWLAREGKLTNANSPKGSVLKLKS
jgi:hypothetical protein